MLDVMNQTQGVGWPAPLTSALYVVGTIKLIASGYGHTFGLLQKQFT